MRGEAKRRSGGRPTAIADNACTTAAVRRSRHRAMMMMRLVRAIIDFSARSNDTIGVGAQLQQQPHHRRPPRVHRELQRPIPAARGTAVEARPMPSQQPHHCQMPANNGVVQRVAPLRGKRGGR